MIEKSYTNVRSQIGPLEGGYRGSYTKLTWASPTTSGIYFKFISTHCHLIFILISENLWFYYVFEWFKKEWEEMGLSMIFHAMFVKS